MTERIDMGVRVAGEKSQLPDEFVTKSQLVTPDGNPLDVAANGDLIVPAATSDHLVLVDELDTNPGTLLDKIYPADSNVTITVTEVGGERVMEIGVIDSGGGLPAGTANQTLRHDGTDWVVSNAVTIDTEGFIVDYQNYQSWGRMRSNSNGSEIKLQSGNDGYLIIQTRPNSAFIRLTSLDCDIWLNSYNPIIIQNRSSVVLFAVLPTGGILSKSLAGTGNRPLYADASGNIKAQSGATGTFTSQDGKTITVTNGIITSIV